MGLWVLPQAWANRERRGPARNFRNLREPARGKASPRGHRQSHPHGLGRAGGVNRGQPLGHEGRHKADAALQCSKDGHQHRSRQVVRSADDGEMALAPLVGRGRA